jgi:hypothetical protein
MAKVIEQRYATVRVDAVQPHPKNPNVGNVDAITESVEENDFYGAMVVHEPTGNILVGSHRWQAARSAGIEELPALLVDVDEDRALRILTADNATGRMAVWNEAALVDVLKGMQPTARGLAGSGFSEAAFMQLVTKLTKPEATVSLADQFLVSPFDVLDGRRGWWLTRRRQWLALGIRSEEGRFEDGEGRAAFKGGWRRGDAQVYGTRSLQREVLGRKLTKDEIEEHAGHIPDVSIFDPVLCELAYRWFSPPAGAVLDPFAGGSVRGVVAALLGRAYHGNDLSARQVAANVAQAAEILPAAAAPGSARWDTGDSLEWGPQLAADSADLIFTCPPYYDTEVYTSQAADLSTMTGAAFEDAYSRILAGVAPALRPDRFAVIVCGDSRAPRTGYLRDMRGATIRAMQAAGLGYCSGAVHVVPSWSLAASASRQFNAKRTLGRMHEDVLVFVKGSAARAAKACGKVEVAFPETPSGAATG